MTAGTQRHQESGMALVAVLWVITSLALLVVSLDISVRSNATITRNNLRTLQQVGRVNAGIEVAVARLRDTNAATRWTAGPATHRLPLDGSIIRIRIEDANARIDLNKSDTELIEKLIAQFAGTDTARTVRQLIDRRRTDAQQEQITAFIDTSQLLDIDGVSFGLYRRLAPFITVYSGDGRINPMSAAREVLLALPKITSNNIEDALRLRATATRGGTPVLAALRNARRWLTRDTGPAFIITADVPPDRDGRGLTSQAILLIDPGSNTSYHVLSWQTDVRS